MELVSNEYYYNKDLIWVVSPEILLQQYPETNQRFDQLLKFGFSSDEYPGEHREPRFSLEENCNNSYECVTLIVYYPLCTKITSENASKMSAFLSIHHVFSDNTITMWNLCSIDRGKGYAGKLVDISISWTNEHYKLPLGLKVYVYNSMFQQVIMFYLKRNFIFNKIERGGSVVCLLHASFINDIIPYQSYSNIIKQCWSIVLQEPPSNERKWLARRLLSLLPKQRL